MLLRREEPRLAFLPEPEALPPDVEHVAVVQQPVQHRRGDDGVAGQFAPLAESLVRCQDDAAPLPSAGSGQAYRADTSVKKAVAASRS